MMGCARNLTNIFRLCTFYDFEEKVIELLSFIQTFIMFLARALQNIPNKINVTISDSTGHGAPVPPPPVPQPITPYVC